MTPLTGPDGRAIPDEERTRCDVYSRVMGYFQPTHQWNAGKQSEFHDRTPYRPSPEQVAEPEQRRLEF